MYPTHSWGRWFWLASAASEVVSWYVLFEVVTEFKIYPATSILEAGWPQIRPPRPFEPRKNRDFTDFTQFQGPHFRVLSGECQPGLNKNAPNFSPVSIVKGCVGEKIAALRPSETLVDPASI